MFKNFFDVHLGKAFSGNNRNVNSYYIVVLNQDQSLKWFSGTLRNDEDNYDTVTGEGVMQPAFI